MLSVCRLSFVRPSSAAAAIAVLTLLLAGAATADVVVLANRTGSQLTFQVQPQYGRLEQLSLAAGDVMPYFSDGRVGLQLTVRGQTASYLLGANSAYFFFARADAGQVGLEKIGLGEDKSTAMGRPLPGSALSTTSAAIPVIILVDEEEPGRPFFWERRLRQRVEATSAILDKYCRIRLNVVAVGTWNSDNAVTDFDDSLREFERKVHPSPARLAIGFTSQYNFQPGRIHLAGMHGPLRSHILVREAARGISEPERVELLVHELGHYLGASHSPERDSVMRPVLGGHHGRGFQIRFDPVNALAIAMVGEEIRRRQVKSFADLTVGTKTRLRAIYVELSRAFPEDTATKQFIRTVDAAVPAAPIVAGTRRVLAEIVHSAQANRALPTTTDGTQQSQRDGDALTQYYVRQAARAAHTLPNEIAPAALLMALGIGLDDSTTLRNLSETKGFVAAVESPQERLDRLATLGRPTMLGRRDLTTRFAQSAYLTSVLGTKAAETAGLGTELRDAQGAGGFSFADVAAHEAGIFFAGGVMKRRFSLPTLADSFSVDSFMPSVESLEAGLSAAQLDARYGSSDDERFQTQLQLIRGRVLQLPPYQRMSAASRP
jgi:hypothetical protein